jgi:hypothetical protein
MWNPFRRKRRQPNRVDDLVNAVWRAGLPQELENELQLLDQSSLSTAEQESWWHAFAMAAYEGGRYAEALQRLEDAHRRFPDHAMIRHLLGQQYIFAGRLDEGFGLFHTCSFPEVPAIRVLLQARYAYIWDRYDDARFSVRPLFDGYVKVKTLDDNAVHMRGLPFFSSSWAYLAAFSVLTGDFDELESVTSRVARKCRDYDFDFLRAELRACRDDEPACLLDAWESCLKEFRRYTFPFPTAHIQMHIAVIRARAATTLADVRRILSGPVLTEQDWPWLEDIRTLALAEAAHRLGDAAVEAESIDTFFERQLMLFEPDIALDFQMLRYQELLKPRLRAEWSQRLWRTPEQP